MKCPNCNVGLLMTERAGTSIDYCPQCRGVWLEKGKLDLIIEKASGNQAAIQPDDRPKQGGGNTGRNRDGRDDEGGFGGFLGNVFGGD